ncbi:hypothetical protein [Acetobacterium woodii]|uniref:hypothetical protein n=1 Tax=Acetobacterium woodii TaxID=33952 RepID=UPI0005A11D6F|nr:hypothetical protein [Acetobacterium woodii]
MKSKKFGVLEILYRDGTSDSFYASVGLCEKIGEEILKGDCLIHVNCQNRKGIEFFSADVSKLSIRECFGYYFKPMQSGGVIGAFGKRKR